jgi:hypothetical protein
MYILKTSMFEKADIDSIAYVVAIGVNRNSGAARFSATTALLGSLNLIIVINKQKD